jgi:HEAT repeat protein
MFARAAALGFLALSLAHATAQDADPVHDGQKVSKWIDAVQNDPSARQRALAIDALGQIWDKHKHKEAIPNVGRALRVDPSAAVRAQAARVIAGLRPDDIKYAVTDLVTALGKEKESRVRKEIVAAVLKFPEVCALALEPLAEALKDPDAAVKVSAAEAIALAGPGSKGAAKAAAPALEPLLKDTDKGVRKAAVYALGRIQPEAAATLSETMAAMFGTEKDADLKRELVAALGLLGEKGAPAVQALGAALSDADDEVRRTAARVLGTFGTAANPVAAKLLAAFKRDAVKDIRIDALRAYGSALGPTGVKAQLPDLRGQLDPTAQPDFEVRLALIDEIAALGWEHLGADLALPDKEDPKRLAALATVGALRARQADPQVKVREAATQAIRKIEKKPEPKKDEKKD